MNPIKQKAFKLVRNVNGRLLSFLRSIHHSPWQIDYSQGGLIKSYNNTGLFIFADTASALRHANCGECLELELWEVEAYSIREVDKVFRIWSGQWHTSGVMNYWRNVKNGNTILWDAMIDSAPSGSLTCSSLRMIRKLEVETDRYTGKLCVV